MGSGSCTGSGSGSCTGSGSAVCVGGTGMTPPEERNVSSDAGSDIILSILLRSLIPSLLLRALFVASSSASMTGPTRGSVILYPASFSRRASIPFSLKPNTLDFGSIISYCLLARAAISSVKAPDSTLPSDALPLLQVAGSRAYSYQSYEYRDAISPAVGMAEEMANFHPSGVCASHSSMALGRPFIIFLTEDSKSPLSACRKSSTSCMRTLGIRNPPRK